MPAYAKDGKVLCFFQPAGKFKARYSTLGFRRLGQARRRHRCGRRAYALTTWSAAVEKEITALVKRAVG